MDIVKAGFLNFFQSQTHNFLLSEAFLQKKSIWYKKNLNMIIFVYIAGKRSFYKMFFNDVKFSKIFVQIHKPYTYNLKLVIF